MSDDEFLIKYLGDIKNQVKEEREDLTGDEYIDKEITEDYDEILELLELLIPKINGIDSLYSLEEDEFEFIVECMEEYSEVFVIDGRSPETLARDEALYSQLSDILFQIYDDDDEDDSDEEYDDDSEEDDEGE